MTFIDSRNMGSRNIGSHNIGSRNIGSRGNWSSVAMTPVMIGLATMTLGVLGWRTTAIAADLPSPDSTPVTQLTSTASTLLFVNPSLGNDAAEGSQRSPFRTITHALQVAPRNTMILLVPGTYSAETGETFPLVMKPGVGIQGDPTQHGQGVIIRGGGDFLSPTSARQNIAILGATQATLTGITLTNPNTRGYGLWIESSHPIVTDNTFTNNTHDGISIVGSSAPVIQDNRFLNNGANGITVYGSSQPQIRNNLFAQTGYAINVAGNAMPLIAGNQIRQNRAGVVVQGNARPVLRDNVLEGQTEDGLVAIAQSQPNMGTASEPGHNIFRNNGRYDINASRTTQMIVAVGNQFSSPTMGQLDLQGTMGASVAVNPAPSPTSTLASPPGLPRLTAPAASVPIPVISSALGRRYGVEGSAPAASVPIPVISPPSSVTGGTAPATRASIQIPVAPAPVREVVIEQPTPYPSAFAATAAPREQAMMNMANFASTPVSATMSNRVAPRPQMASTAAAERSLPRPRNTIVVSRPPILPSNLLPVPDGNAPIGNIGDMPTVMVSRNALDRPVRQASVAQVAALGLRYRVVVEAADEITQTLVRSLVPGAFRTYVNGRTLMQVGAYSDRANADETVQLLTNNGLRAVVQRIE